MDKDELKTEQSLQNSADEVATSVVDAVTVDMTGEDALASMPILDTAEILPASDDESKILSARPEIIYHISDFDGPLDMLVTMIKEAKIDIEDLFISEVTGQYVEVIKNTPKEDLDFDYAGEFITVAAELVYLKSVRSLPREEEEVVDEDDPEYLRQLFILKVKEYALMKEQSEKLRSIETTNRFFREPVYSEKDYRVSLTNFSLPKLVEAYAHVLATAQQIEHDAVPKKVVKDRFSVHDQMVNIRELARKSGKLTFTSLFDQDFDRNDIVTTFLAVLELLKYQKLRAEQTEQFGEITLYDVEGEDKDEPITFDGEDYR